MLCPSILIVEDEAVVAEDLAQKIKALGYRVLDIASTGAAALQISQAHPPDLILLDITLAGKLDGIETATRIKEFSDIPLVFLTAHSDTETVKRATAAGSLGYILKPFRERDLEVQLRAALYMSEHKKTEQKLRKTEDLLLRAQRGAQAGVWEIDLRTERIRWSEPYYDLVGLDRSTEPSVAAWLSCIHPEDRERVLAGYSQSIKEKCNQNMEYRIVKPNGDVRWVQRQGQVELDEQGNPRRINGITFDITDRKQAEEVVQKSEDRYRKLYESIDEGFCIIQVLFDANNRAVDYVFLEVNPSFEKQTGIQDAQGRSMRQIAPHHEEHWFEMYGDIALNGQSKRFEYPADELHRWYEGYAYRIGEDTERKVAIIFNDITDRKQAEEAVKAIALFPSQNPSPVLRVSSAGILLYMNEVSHQLLRDLDLRLGQPVPIILENLVRNALEATESQQAEYCVGSCHYLITVTPVADGNYANFYWTDISERKRAEAALRENQQRLEELVNSAMDAVITIDADQRIVLFNPAAERMFGCPANEALRSSIERFIPESFRSAHGRHVDQFGKTGTTTRRMGALGSVSGLRVNGEEFPIEASISQMVVGGHRLFTVILRDITDRKRAEAAVLESEQRLQHWNEQLEQRVAERTQELIQSQERLRALATELNLAEQRERTRVANDLHDYLAQLLVLGRFTLARAKRIGLPSQAEKLIKESEDTLDKALTYCRTLMTELSPPILQQRGLSEGLIWLGEHMKRQDLEVTVKVENGDSVMLPEDRVVLLFQSVRELLINVAKHGAIKKAEVTMTHRDGLLTIIVRDENGFDLTTAPARISPLSSKFGLFSIRERMKALSGTFEITSSPRHGTTATLTLPLWVPTDLPSQNCRV